MSCAHYPQGMMFAFCSTICGTIVADTILWKSLYMLCKHIGATSEKEKKKSVSSSFDWLIFIRLNLLECSGGQPVKGLRDTKQKLQPWWPKDKSWYTVPRFKKKRTYQTWQKCAAVMDSLFSVLAAKHLLWPSGGGIIPHWSAWGARPSSDARSYLQRVRPIRPLVKPHSF